jgi:hypothetical protein
LLEHLLSPVVAGDVLAWREFKIEKLAKQEKLSEYFVSANPYFWVGQQKARSRRAFAGRTGLPTTELGTNA